MGDSLSSDLPAHCHSDLQAEPCNESVMGSGSTSSMQSSSSPIAHVPDELLLEVFSYACCEFIDVGRLREPIWDLQQVCVRWQRVVKSAPSLWSAFQVTIGDVHVDSIALRIQSCLKLSGNNPLSISLVYFPPTNDDDDEDFPFKIYTELPDHANRWESLVVDGDLLEHIVVHRPSVGSAVAKHGLSNLRKLAIIYPERYHYYLFCGAPALKELKLINPKHLPKANDIFPWKNIERFTFDDCKTVQSEKRFINAFRSMAKSLQVLTWCENDRVLYYVPDTVITLSALHTIITKDAEIEDWDPTPKPVPLWDMFRMPALTDIRIIGDMDTSFDSFLSMIQLSRSVVKKLEFKECFPVYMLLSLAEALSDIEELFLEDLRDPEECVPMLVWNTTEPLMRSYAGKDVIKILPSLRKLEIRDTLENTGTILMDIMRSRSATAAAESAGGVLLPLQSLKWMISDSLSAKASIEQKKHYGVDDDTISQIKNLGNELGINVEIDLHWIP